MITATELTLQIYIQGNLDQTLYVAQEQITIGRLAECDIYLPYSEVSRRHCQLRKLGTGKWQLEELGSINGTSVNRDLVKPNQPRVIQRGDVIQIGDITIKAQLATTPQFCFQGNDQSSCTKVQTIVRNAEQLRQRWMEGDLKKDAPETEQTTQARLHYIVEIAKGLNRAESMEAIFSQVETVIFQELHNLERLALLIDVDGSGQLQLYKAAARYLQSQSTLYSESQELERLYQGDWISEDICNKAFRENSAIKITNAQSDTQLFQNQDICQKPLGNALAIPLWNDKQVIGVLYADGTKGFDDLDPNQDDQDLSFFSTIANFVAVSVQRWLLSRRLQEQERIRQRLERYHSPVVVQQLIHCREKENTLLKPMEADVTVLFADIVGFTTLSDQLQPEQVAKLLNQFFEEMLKPLFAMGGTLDKFIGDCIMAFFGAPEPQSDHADRAVKVAKAMRNRLEQLNQQCLVSEPLQLRIAINSGKAVVGDVGSSQRVDYTVLGATVNLASRLEAECEPDDCVITQQTFSRLKSQQGFTPMGTSSFKGINQPITIYRAQW